MQRAPSLIVLEWTVNRTFVQWSNKRFFKINYICFTLQSQSNLTDLVADIYEQKSWTWRDVSVGFVLQV